jgi:hypothetical protein
MGRDYKKERKYDGKASVKKKRAARNRARRKLKNSGVNVEGKDVHHKDGNANNNSLSNLTTKSPSKNRSVPRTKTARKKRPKAVTHKRRK